LFVSFFFSSSSHHRVLHSFPTRRSSDLRAVLHQPPHGSLVCAECGGTRFERASALIAHHGGERALYDRAQRLPVQPDARRVAARSEEHTSELQSLAYLVCRLLLEKKKKK